MSIWSSDNLAKSLEDTGKLGLVVILVYAERGLPRFCIRISEYHQGFCDRSQPKGTGTCYCAADAIRSGDAPAAQHSFRIVSQIGLTSNQVLYA